MGAEVKVLGPLLALQIGLASALIVTASAGRASGDTVGDVVQGTLGVLQGVTTPVVTEKMNERKIAIHGRCIVVFGAANEIPCNATQATLESAEAHDSVRAVITNGAFDFILYPEFKYQIKIESDKYRLIESPAEVSTQTRDFLIRLKKN